MKSIKCNSLTPLKCDFEAHGETSEDTKHALYEHLATAHPDIIARMSFETKIVIEDEMDEIMALAE